MSCTIQSSDYVPGVSGLNINLLTGEFEINSCTLGSASKAPERQMVSVEVASYSKYDLPKNAANLLQFMQAELQKVPEQYRHSAEFEEFDASYGDESFDARLFLSYSRLETEEELADRLAKAKYAGTRIVCEGGCTTAIRDGVVQWRFGDLSKPVDIERFKVGDGVNYVSKAFVDKASVSEPYAAGLGLGDPSQVEISVDRFAINVRDASEILLDYSALLGTTKLCSQLRENIDQLGSSFADQVREVIRSEIRQGGLLHRSR